MPIIRSKTGGATGALPAALGQTTMAASLPVVIASNQSAVSVTLPAATVDANNNLRVNEAAAASVAFGVQTSTNAAAQLVAARTTRKRCLVKNTDAANVVWCGGAGVTFGTLGIPLKAGESFEYKATAALSIIDNGAHAVVAFEDDFD